MFKIIPSEIVDIHFAHRVFKIHLQRIAIADNAGVVHQNVDKAECGGRADIIFISNVEFDWRNRRAHRGCIVLQLLNIFRSARAGKNFARAGFRKRKCQRAAEAATCAGD
jgi:hypothetical protein